MSWPLPENDDELLALATGYPFQAPGFSYIYRDGDITPLSGSATSVSGSASLSTSVAGQLKGRHPVIAHGSNRAPAQLHRKYGHLNGRASEIPVTRVLLSDYDVVYSAHVTQYGAIAANLQHAPGAVVEVYVTWLDDAQLLRMHDTELGGENYYYGRLDNIRLAFADLSLADLSAAFVYLSTRGCLAQDGQAIGLEAVPARERPHRALGQREVLEFVRGRYRPERDLDAHALHTIRDPHFRRALVFEMEQDSVAAAAPHFTILERP